MAANKEGIDMAKGSIATRIERLESQVNGEGLEGDLYNSDGEQVTDARIVKWPTREHCGLAIMADGSRREIHAKVSLLDIIMERRRQAESRIDTPERSEEERAAAKAESQKMLWIRTDGKPGMMERILSNHHGREAERGEV